MIYRVVYCKAKSGWLFMSSLINSVQKIDASHVAIEFIHPCGEKLFLDASSKTVRLVSEKMFKKKYEITKIYNHNKVIDGDEFAKYFIPLLGTKYSYMQVFGNFLMVIGLFSKNIRRDGARRLICNEVVELFLNKFFRDKELKHLEDFDLDDTNAHLKLLGFF